MERLIADAREYIIEVSGRRMMIACLMAFELLPAVRFSGFSDLLASLDASVSLGLRRDRPDRSESAHG